MPSASHSSYFTENALTRISKALAQFEIELDHEFVLSQGEDLVLNELVNDSRAVKSGDIFVAVFGHDTNGCQYIDKAIAQGANLVIAQCETSTQHGQIRYVARENAEHAPVAIVSFYQLSEHLYHLASDYYQQPQQQLTMVGITGTNGKTTTSQIIANLLEANNHACGIIGTVGAGRLNQLTPINNTTPGATQLLTLLAGFAQDNISHVAMEVSSHALAQRRVTNELFDISVFTNLSRDHLDYHNSMDEYAAAKYKIFAEHAKQTAVINGDDEQANVWLNDDNALNNQPVIVYGKSEKIKQYSQYLVAENIHHHAHGVDFTACTHLGDVAINSPLLGDFNIDNLLAAIAVLLAGNISLTDIAKAVSLIKPIAGRMETFEASNKATTVVDYAHTPDALENALLACRKHCSAKLWVVFGCGGDRDKGKRSLMGKIAEQHADRIIITNDNPRSESASAIANDILSGCQFPEKVDVMLDRKQAVSKVVTQASPQDVILLAGKGHEKNIIIGNDVLPYDERALVHAIYHNEVTL